MMDDSFWEALDTLAAESEIIIDRPKGSAHPRYPGFIYPLDYGYLKATTSMDGGGIDVWRGSDPGCSSVSYKYLSAYWISSSIQQLKYSLNFWDISPPRLPMSK